MKKQLWLLLVCLHIPNVYAARGERKALEIHPSYVALKNEVRNLTTYRYALRGATTLASYMLGLRAVGVLPNIMTPIEQYTSAVMKNLQNQLSDEDLEKQQQELNKLLLKTGFEFLIPGLTSATIGAMNAEFTRRSILRHINRVLTQNKTGYEFKKLPIDDAIMVLAAYQKNAYVMRKLKPFVQSFLEKPGVWQALSQLYFFKSSWWRPTMVDIYFGSVAPADVEKLKEALE